MCGIAALVSWGQHSDFRAIEAMSRLVRHRGPDDEGLVFFSGASATPVSFGGPDTPIDCFEPGHPYLPAQRYSGGVPSDTIVALAHRRLSIVDLSSAGHQPMCFANQRLWIVYNGEVYNYLELRAELEQLGYTFRSHTDTEVMLAAYAEWGRDCLARFNGMFAFVLLDRAKQRIFAARDRFGVKPLYYRVAPSGMLAFASEIKQFTALSDWAPRINGQIAYDFLNWGLSDHTEETFFRDVHQLRNGEALELNLHDLPQAIQGRRLPVYTWYRLAERQFSGSLATAAEQFCELLVDSVRLRLRADVAVGSCLSGGLDSSSIVCVLNALLQERGSANLQQTFSACAEDQRFDERGFVDAVVARTGAAAHYVYPTLDELWDVLDDITWHQDEPFGSTSIYAQWHVFRLAREHGVKVMLDGQGADEILGGYHGYFSPYFARLALDFRWRQLLREIAAVRRIHGYSTAWALKQSLNALLPQWLLQPARRLAGKSSMESDLFDLTCLSAAPSDPYLELNGTRPRAIRELSLSQLMRTSVQMLLHWEDRDSMIHSIESRVPFLDYRLVEFTLGLPDQYKICDGMTKRVLREAMTGILPESVRMRTDKLGFVTPEESWIRAESPERFRAALSEAIEASGGIIRGRAVKLFDDMVDGRQPFTYMIWRLISFGNWMRVFKVAN